MENKKFQTLVNLPVVEVHVNGVKGWLVVDYEYLRSYLDKNFYESAGGTSDELIPVEENFCIIGKMETVANSKYLMALVGTKMIKFPMCVIDFQNCYAFVRNESGGFAGILGKDFFEDNDYEL